ncbi:MAG: EAL domain-containing protein [Chromatiales bacterium]|nr:EAL domain-containing protein [Chromatiales bacterium]
MPSLRFIDQALDVVPVSPQDHTTRARSSLSHLHKITLILIIGNILAIILLASYLTQTQYESAIRQWIDHKKDSTVQLARWVDGELNLALSDLQYIAGTQSFRTEPNADLIVKELNGIPADIDLDRHQALDWLHKKDDRFSVLFVLLPNGDHYISHPFEVQKSLQTYNLSERTYFQTVKRTHQPTISNTFIGADGIPAVAIDVPILNNNDEITSHLGGVFYLSNLHDTFTQSPYAENSEGIFLLDRAGNLITHNDYILSNIEVLRRQPFVENFLAQQTPTTDLYGYRIASGHLPASAEANEHVMILAQLNTGWTLGISADMNSILAQFQPGIWHNIILAATLLVLTSTIAIIAVYRIGSRWQKAEHAVSNARDNLEMKVAERTQELVEKESRLRLLIETIPDVVWLKNRQGQYLSCNKKCELLLGASEADIIGKTIFNFINHDLATSLTARDQQVMESSLTDVSEIWVSYSNDHHKELLEITRTPVFDTSGEVIGVLGIGRDTTERREAENALKESEVFRQRVFESSSVPMVVMDSKTLVFLDCNPAAVKIYGFTKRSEVLGKTPLNVSTPTQYDGSLSERKGRHYIEAALRGESVEFEWRHQRPGGQLWDAQVHLMSFKSGNETLLQFILTDITERKRTAVQLKTLSQAIEQSPVSVMITNTDAEIEYVNSTFENITGYTATEVINHNPRMLQSGNTPKGLYRDLWRTITNGRTWQGEFQNRKKNGELFWEQANIAPVIDEAGVIRHYLAVKEDITLRKQQERRILHQAHFDTLTDLPNRFLSLDRLSQLLNDADRDETLVAILFVDLDDFKKINDTLGHDAGDKLLIQASARLRNTLRGSDTVGRLGGDEFIILLGGLTSASDTRKVADSLLTQFREPFKIDGRELIITASVGIAIYPQDGNSPSELLRNADSAMYHSKEQGRNTYSYFTDAMNQEVARRLALEEQMHGALDRNEFTLYYQPVVNIIDNHIVGVEALLRWHNRALGQLSPTEFIPLAEQTGQIIPIGQFILDQALQMASIWRNQCDSDLKIAINLSPRQFRDPKLVSCFKDSIIHHQVPGNSLELEITEGVLMGSHSHIDQAITALNQLGIGIAMDDFGTGYSSLSYLRQYPFDVLKIDRSFVNDITVDPADRELIKATIAMAHSLGLKVIAEGVETDEQLQFLKKLRCDYAQGYLFSKPLPPDEITSLLIQQQPLH